MASVLKAEDRHENYLIVSEPPSSKLDDESREVYIVHRVMKDGMVEDITNFVHEIEKALDLPNDGIPHPLHHWGVLVGDTLHHLQADSFMNAPNYYQSMKFPKDEGYIPYKVGTTTFNDLAIQESGVQTIYAMPKMYDVIKNSCQTFTINLLDIIVRSGRVKVKPAQVYTEEWSAFIPVPIEDLRDYVAKSFEAPSLTAAVVQHPAAQEELLKNVQNIMDEKTPVVTKEQIESTVKASQSEPQTSEAQAVEKLLVATA